MKKMTYSIDTCEDIELNGSVQNIRIRGTDPTNPVLLFLHGGPGICDRHTVLKYHSPLSDACTLVCWDQRCAGKNYRAKEAKTGQLNIDVMLEDAAQLCRMLTQRFGCEKVSVVGHSWGSILGVLLAQKYPELIENYIGMGQFINGPQNEMLSYRFALQQAMQHNDHKAISALKRIGEPKNGTYANLKGMRIQRKYLSKFGGAEYGTNSTMMHAILLPLLETSEYHFADILKYAKGAYYSLEELWDEVVALNFRQTVPSLDVPVWILQGSHDYNTPTILAHEWFNQLTAPSKRWVTFEHSAHHPIKEEPEKWESIVRGILSGTSDTLSYHFESD